jgi:hypothetical protein
MVQAATCCGLLQPAPEGRKIEIEPHDAAGYIPGVSGFVVPYIQRYIFYFT